MQEDEVQAELAEASRLHQAGRLDEAVAGYARVLAARPDDADALNLTGVAALQRKDAPGALPYLRRAATSAPGRADIHHHLGEALRLSGDAAAALAAYREAVRLDASRADSHHAMAVVLSALEKHSEAATAAAAARRLAANHAGYAFRHGAALAQAGDNKAAAAAFRGAIALDPRNAEAHFSLGVVLERDGAAGPAARAYHRAIQLRPDDKRALNNLAALMQIHRRFATARRLLDRTLALDPGDSRTLNNIAKLRLDDGDVDGAKDAARRAIAIAPNDPTGHIQLATAMQTEGLVDEPLALYRAAVRLAPEDPVAHVNLALALLLTGQLEEGGRENEWRWRSPASNAPVARPFPQPWWAGEDLADKTILVWGEQGIGDEIQFAALLPRLAARAGRLVVETEHRLRPLLARSFPDIECYARDPDGPPHPRLLGEDIDAQVPIGSLAQYLGRTPDDLKVAAPYLTPDAAKFSTCRARYDVLGDGLKVGISWHSASRYFAQRNAPLALWGPVLLQPGLRLFDLQYGDHHAERAAAAVEWGIDMHHDEQVDQLASLDDFAAQVAAMDLVISISNTTVHMAGALGVECWTILPLMADWRWFVDRDDTPWYPTMRLFRQQRQGDWAGVIDTVASALTARAL